MTHPLSRRIYERLLRLYPTEHLRRFGPDMVQCFERMHREPRHRDLVGRARLWFRVLADVTTNATLLHLSGRRRRHDYSRRSVSHGLESLWRELVLGSKRLLRRRSFTMVAVVTIAVGIGANVLVFTVVQATLVNPLPYPEPERVTSIWPEHWFSRGELAYFEERAATMEIAGSLSSSIVYLDSEEPLQLAGLHVSPGYFDLFRVSPFLGRSFEDLDGDASTAVLSYGLWQRLFGGDSDILGETMILDGRPFQIVGVMPSSFAALPLGGEIWLPMEMDPSSGRYEGTNEIKVIGRLGHDVSRAQALEELARIADGRQSDFGHLYSDEFGQDLTLAPLQETVTEDFRKPLVVLQVAVVFLLLMACVNVANIVLAGASARTTELGIRAALGASRGQIVRQLTAESALIAVFGTGAGLVIAYVCLPFVISALPFEQPEWLTIAIDGKVLGFTAALATIGTVAFGVLPGLASSGADLKPALKTGQHRSRGSARFRSVLVGSEMALAMVLLVGAALMIKSFKAVLEEDLGFATDHIATMRLHPSPVTYEEPARSRDFYRDVLSRIRTLPGIDDAGVARRLPLQGAWFTRIHLEGVASTNNRGHAVQWSPADPGYFRTLAIAIVEGRGFDGTEQAETQPVALVNETFARRLLGNASPVGRRLRFTDSEDTWITVVGVVRDAKQNGPRGFGFPMVFRPFEQSPVRSMRLVVRTGGDAIETSASIRAAIWSVDPRVPISEVGTMDQILSSALTQPRLPVVGLTIFAGIALLLGMGGLYGVVSYVTSQRRYDIGVHMALGAQRRHVLLKLIGLGMRPVIVGMAAGLAGSIAMSRFIASLLYAVSPTDPFVLANVTAFLALAALAACYLPAHRASRIDPTEALRIQ